MCEFCVQHGEGKKWYLQAKNYSEDLLSDLRRSRAIVEFLSEPERIASAMQEVSRLDRQPTVVRAAVRKIITGKMKKRHFGQVVPIEEIEEIFGFANTIVRIGCVCRYVTLKEDRRYCYGVSLAPDGGRLAQIIGSIDQSFLKGPDNAGLERVGKDEAMSALHAHESEGLCHTVWTFQTPFICSICNCDRSDCVAMRMAAVHRLQLFFRGEYVASVDESRCEGCRECMRLCQFGALCYSAASRKVTVDPTWCYGCGVCRAACSQEAIKLLNRADVPAAANLW